VFTLFLSAVAFAMPVSWLLSGNAVVDEDKWLGVPMHADVGVQYQHPVQLEPMLPFVAFGMRFDDDLMVGLKDDGIWGMTEVSRVYLPNGDSVWFALDSMLDGRQFVGLPDDPRAVEIAASFPAPTYSSGLVVEESESTNGETEFHATWTRRDGEPMALWMRASDQDKPPRKRNGNGMNHSQGSVLAMLDLFSVNLVGGEQLAFQTDHPRGVQRVLGTEVAARMRQVVAGLRAGDWVQDGVLLTDSAGNEVSFQLVDSGEQVWLESIGQPQQLRYQFDKVADQFQLREIRLFQAAAGRDSELMHMQFNPSLPDLRHGPPKIGWEGRVATTIHGMRGWHQGIVRVDDVDGDAEVMLVSTAPNWAARRPVWSRLDYGEKPSLQSRILAAGGEQAVEALLPLGERFNALRSPAVVDMVWDKRPHRLSTLSILVDAVDPTKDVVSLGGGTWANGVFASDSVHYTVQTVEVEGDELYALQTPRFPLVALPLLPGEQPSSVLGVVNATVPLPSDSVGKQVIVWVRGFSLTPGPAHMEAGITTRGLRVAIAHQRVEGDLLKLVLHMSHEIGGVPDRRQHLTQYSALGQISLGLSLSSMTNQPRETVDRQDISHPRRILGRAPLPLACDESRTWAPLLSWALTLRNDEKHAGRYLRRLTIDATADGADGDFENVGAWARPVNGSIERTLLFDTGLQWRSGSCISGY
jgi:hypothetical protein